MNELPPARTDFDSAAAPPHRTRRYRASDLPLVLIYCAIAAVLFIVPLGIWTAGRPSLLTDPDVILGLVGAFEAAIIVVIAIWRRQRGYTWRRLGMIPPTARQIALGVLIAPVFMVIQWLVPGQDRPLPVTPHVFNLMVNLVTVGALAPVAEELLFRGVIYRWIAERAGFTAGMVLSSLVFAAMHFDRDPINFAHIFLIGAACAYLFERSGTLWTTITLHGVHNSFVIILSYYENLLRS